MNIKTESEIITEDEMSLYDYWEVLIKRKKILLGIFLVPLVIVTVVSLSLPRYYRGESEISMPALPDSSIVTATSGPNTGTVMSAPNVVKLIGNLDDSKKVKIFTNNPGAIKRVSVSLSKKTNDKVNIIVDAETADIIPQAFKDISDYISNLPEIKREIERIKGQIDLKIKNLIEARKANRVYLSQITETMKKRPISFINVNPADIIKKDYDLYLEIMNLQNVKGAGILGPLLITKQPSKSQIERWIVITCLLSLFTGIIIVFFLEKIDRMKARNIKNIP